MKRNHFIFGFILSLITLSIVLFLTLPKIGYQNSQQENIDPGSEPEIQTSVVIDNLNKPWDINFINENTIIYNLKGGEIRRYDLLTQSDWQITTIDDVYNRGEGGLLGGVLDINFSENNYYFVCSNVAGPSVSVIRLTLASDLKSVLERKDIVTGIPSNESGRHSGCRLDMDKNGHLWIGTGDIAEGTNPQNLNSLGGKVLRVDRDGKGVEGNLRGSADPRIFNFGHRNVQGITLFNEEINGVYGFTSEHGSSRDDEINLLTQGNFGWDPIPGYDESVEMTDSTKFPSAIESIWSSGNPTIAVSGMTIIRGAQWGNWNGAVALAVQKDQHIRVIKFNNNYEIEFESVIVNREFGRIRTVVQSPNGDLFFTTDNGNNDKIVRIQIKN